jgi:hypothetical protein
MKIHMNGFHPIFKHSCKKCNIAFETSEDLVYHKFIMCPVLYDPLAQQESDYNIFLKKKEEEDKEKHVEEQKKFMRNLKVKREDRDNKNLADKKMEKSEMEGGRKVREEEEAEERNMTNWEKE